MLPAGVRRDDGAPASRSVTQTNWRAPLRRSGPGAPSPPCRTCAPSARSCGGPAPRASCSRCRARRAARRGGSRCDPVLHRREHDRRVADDLDPPAPEPLPIATVPPRRTESTCRRPARPPQRGLTVVGGSVGVQTVDVHPVGRVPGSAAEGEAGQERAGGDEAADDDCQRRGATLAVAASELGLPRRLLLGCARSLGDPRPPGVRGRSTIARGRLTS